MAKKLSQDHILLVEGKNDEHVIGHFAQASEIKVAWEFRCGDGDADLTRLFSEELRTSGKEIIGIILDADERNRWQQIKDRIAKSRHTYSLPDGMPAEGLVIDGEGDFAPRIGAWIMPNNREVGMLEDFVRYLIPPKDDLAPRVEQALDSLQQDGLDRWRIRQKAFIHTWLAWQKEPGNPMGTAIKQKVLCPGSNEANVFADWLRRLFQTERASRTG